MRQNAIDAEGSPLAVTSGLPLLPLAVARKVGEHTQTPFWSEG